MSPTCETNEIDAKPCEQFKAILASKLTKSKESETAISHSIIVSCSWAPTSSPSAASTPSSSTLAPLSLCWHGPDKREIHRQGLVQ